MPISNHAYVSASTSSSITISGPPTTLKQFFETSKIFTKDHLALPVYGPYHAQHLHKGIEAKSFLRSPNTKTSHILTTYRLALPLISTSNGQFFDEKLEAPALLTGVIENIMKRPLHLEKVVDGCKNLANGLSKYNMVSFGPNSAESMIMKALESETNATVEIREAFPTKIPEGLTAYGDAPRTSRRPKLAVVGMAGRFPNAADHEKFWDLLEAGLDVHKRVRYDLLKSCCESMLTLHPRCRKTDSISRLTMILPERSAIQAILHTAVSSMNQVSSILVSSTCRLAKQHKQILCIDSALQVLTKLWRWQAMSPIDRHPQD